MADVVDISGGASKRAGLPNQEVIDFARKVLEGAESGNIQHLAVVWVEPTGFVGDGYAPGGHPTELYPVIGGLEVCKATLVEGIRISFTED